MNTKTRSAHCNEDFFFIVVHLYSIYVPWAGIEQMPYRANIGHF